MVVTELRNQIQSVIHMNETMNSKLETTMQREAEQSAIIQTLLEDVKNLKTNNNELLDMVKELKMNNENASTKFELIKNEFEAIEKNKTKSNDIIKIEKVTI